LVPSASVTTVFRRAGYALQIFQFEICCDVIRYEGIGFSRSQRGEMRYCCANRREWDLRSSVSRKGQSRRMSSGCDQDVPAPSLRNSEQLGVQNGIDKTVPVRPQHTQKPAMRTSSRNTGQSRNVLNEHEGWQDLFHQMSECGEESGIGDGAVGSSVGIQVLFPLAAEGLAWRASGKEDVVRLSGAQQSEHGLWRHGSNIVFGEHRANVISFERFAAPRICVHP